MLQLSPGLGFRLALGRGLAGLRGSRAFLDLLAVLPRLRTYYVGVR